MGVSHIPLCNLEFEHLLPAGDTIIADQDTNARRRKQHVPLRTAAEAQSVTAVELYQIGKGIMLTIIKDSMQRIDFHAGSLLMCPLQRRNRSRQN